MALMDAVNDMDESDDGEEEEEIESSPTDSSTSTTSASSSNPATTGYKDELGFDDPKASAAYRKYFADRVTKDPTISDVASKLPSPGQQLSDAQLGDSIGSQDVPTRPRQQIRSLQQLGAVANALKGVPEELKNRIISHLLGLQYQSPRDQALTNSMKEIALRAKLQQPYQQARLNQSQASLAERAQHGKDVVAQRAQSHEDLQAQRQKLMALREQQQRQMAAYRDAQVKNAKDRGRTATAGAIDRTTRQLELTMDPAEKVRLGKMLNQLHKQYEAYGAESDNEKAANGEGGVPEISGGY